MKFQMPEMFQRPRNRSVDRLPSQSEKSGFFTLNEEEKKAKAHDPCDPIVHPLKKT